MEYFFYANSVSKLPKEYNFFTRFFIEKRRKMIIYIDNNLQFNNKFNTLIHSNASLFFVVDVSIDAAAFAFLQAQ